ncbi:MAG TPA: 5-dehydro-4-deoxy-D-glucuronate isomerase [Chitinophagaceae bacterium]|nr:5-dehydro-4-deoxy-D-glucuronate isomerase [Chitinophagaceae bacterium]
MEIRFQNSPKETMEMNTTELRDNFLMQGLMLEDEVKLVYSHYDRVIIGGAVPIRKSLKLTNPGELKAEYFLERREIGIINVGADGVVIADGKEFALSKLDCLYLGRGTKEVEFRSKSKKQPALFYLMSAPAHQKYPNKMMKKDKAAPVNMGDPSTSNVRTIYKFIHLDGLKSCQLVMGITVLSNGSVWNSVPPHTHTRRMEVYFYFDVPDQHRVFHFMGQPRETRHIVVANHDAVVSPPWSMHFGCGTSSYGFIWGMAGENQMFTDMDPVPVPTIQ